MIDIYTYLPISLTFIHNLTHTSVF